jgi:hypothetical protein
MDITNSSGGSITLDDLHVEWVSGGSQKINEVLLGGNSLYSGNENNSPSDFPSEQSWNDYPNEHQIGDGGTKTLLIQFADALGAGTYSLRATFSIGCYVEDSLVVP